jgi:ABC-type sugar transport system permease subunit
MVIILGALQSIPQDLYDAAHADGANRLQRFRFITVPLIRPFLVVLVLVDLISTTGVFDVVRLLTNGGPVRSTQTIAYYIWETGFRDVNFGLGSAMSVAMLLMIGFGTFIYVRIVTRRQ